MHTHRQQDSRESVIFEEPVLLKYKEVGIRFERQSFEQGMTQLTFPKNIPVVFWKTDFR